MTHLAYRHIRFHGGKDQVCKIFAIKTAINERVVNASFSCSPKVINFGFAVK